MVAVDLLTTYTMELLACICLLVCFSAGLCKNAEPICTKLGGRMGRGPEKDPFNFEGDLFKGMYEFVQFVADPNNNTDMVKEKAEPTYHVISRVVLTINKRKMKVKQALTPQCLCLWSLGGRVVLNMAGFVYNWVRQFIEWSWRINRSFFVCCFRGLTLAGRYVLYIGWTQGNDEGNDEGTDPQVEISEDQREDQREAAAQQSLAGTGQRADEEHDEDDDEDDDGFGSGEYRVVMSDELYCDYDSTWETEDHEDGAETGAVGPAGASYHRFHRFQNAARDMQNYRHDYPISPLSNRWLPPYNQDMPSDLMPNLEFYLGHMASLPDGVYIHGFHNDWKGEYAALERVHTFIQWLFPLQEPGMNHQASTLTKEEIKEFLRSSTAKENLLKSYELMLDFYGIELYDKETGKVKRASNWRKRFSNLNNHTHNNLRITRILKCLGTLGFPHYQAPLVHFFLEETLVHGELPNVKESVLNYFVFAVLDKKQRRNLIKYAYLNYDPKDQFVWCPRKIQNLWSELSVSKPQKGVNSENNSRACPE